MTNYNSPSEDLREQGLFPDNAIAGGSLQNASDSATLGAPVAINDVIRYVRVPVIARVQSILFSNTDHGTTGNIALGLYEVGEEGEPVNISVFSGLVDLTIALSFTERRYETHQESSIVVPMWELAGLSERPLYQEFQIAATVLAATDGAGTSTMRVTYTV